MNDSGVHLAEKGKTSSLDVVTSTAAQNPLGPGNLMIPQSESYAHTAINFLSFMQPLSLANLFLRKVSKAAPLFCTFPSPLFSGSL